MIASFLLLLIAIPVGFLIARLTADELIPGRLWFRRVFVFALLGIIGCWLFFTPESAWTCGFIAIVSLISYCKSFDKKWAKKR